MTLSTDDTPEDKAITLAPVPGSTDPDRFVDVDEPTATPRGLRARLLDYSAHAAMIVGLIGFAWTVGDHVVHRPLPDAHADHQAAAAPAAADPISELRERNRALAETIGAMQARLDRLQADVGGQAAMATQVRGLQAGLNGLEAGLGTVRTEQTATVARLDGKIDKIAHDPGSKIQQLVDRLGRLERGGVDAAPTASLPHGTEAEPKIADTKPATSARPLPRPAELKTEARADRPIDQRTVESKIVGDGLSQKPTVLAGWVVRDVHQGVALIEGRRGTLEVVPGVSIPGGGVVKSIERRGIGWTVVTTKGAMAYAGPMRENRRADRGYYGGYPDPMDRYDF